MSNIKTQTENPKGLHQRYFIQKIVKNPAFGVTITDTLGCPKPAFDTVIVIVQKVVADAGPRDTTIVINQPLQLNATGGQFYLWDPPTGLKNVSIANHGASLKDNIQYGETVST